MHWIVCCMDIKTLDLRPMFQNVNGRSNGPVVDLATVNGRSRSQPSDPLCRCFLWCERDARTLAQEGNSLLFAGDQSGRHPDLGCMFEERRRQQEVGGFHVLFMTGARIEIGVTGNSMLFREDSATNG